MNCANTCDRELQRSEKSSELDQPNRGEAKQAADRKNKLRTPDILKAIARRGENAERVIAPEQGKIERNCNNQRSGGDRYFLHALFLARGSMRSRLKCQIQKKPIFYLTGRRLSLFD